MNRKDRRAAARFNRREAKRYPYGSFNAMTSKPVNGNSHRNSSPAQTTTPEIPPIPDDYYLAIRMQAMANNCTPEQYVAHLQDDIDFFFNTDNLEEVTKESTAKMGRAFQDHFKTKPDPFTYFRWLTDYCATTK